MPNHDTSFCCTWSKVNNYYTQDIFKKKSEKVGFEHSSTLKNNHMSYNLSRKSGRNDDLG